MEQIFGDFVELDTNDNREYLVISFSPTSIPLQQRWRNNGLSADFLADYLSTFFPGEDDESLSRRTEIKDGVNFVANELLENAMKFNFQKNKYPVRLYMELKQGQVEFYITNSIDPASIDAWQCKLNRILTEDTQELFMEQLMNNDNTNNTESGLGYLSMINDWNAKLAWKFETDLNNAELHKVTVMVQLPI